MTLPLETLPVPLRDDGQGGLRVGQSRIPLERVWHAHQCGDSPADIVRNFDTLDLADLYIVLAWALRHPAEIDAYLKRRQQQADDMRQQLQVAGHTSPPGALKARLLARKAVQGTTDGALPD